MGLLVSISIEVVFLWVLCQKLRVKLWSKVPWLRHKPAYPWARRSYVCSRVLFRTDPYSLANLWPTMMVLKFPGSMGSLASWTRTVVFMVHECGNPSSIAQLNMCTTRGVIVELHKEKCSPRIPMWFAYLPCCNLLMAFSTMEVVKKVDVVGVGMPDIVGFA